MGENLLVLLGERRCREELVLLEEINTDTAAFGLTLTQEDAGELIVSRNACLAKYQRVEFGKGILDKLIYTFCDSRYMEQDEYLETLEQLLDVFYGFKQASEDKLTDEELLTFMKEQFETVCYGDVEYLQSTCLERFTKAIRGGYKGYQSSGGQGEYSQFSEEMRWDSDVYMSILKELFW